MYVATLGPLQYRRWIVQPSGRSAFAFFLTLRAKLQYTFVELRYPSSFALRFSELKKELKIQQFRS
jgi:hypothetical protein